MPFEWYVYAGSYTYHPEYNSFVIVWEVFIFFNKLNDISWSYVFSTFPKYIGAH